jgi:hypothetical protein
MKTFKKILLTLGIIASFGMAVMPATAGAIQLFPDCPDGAVNGVCKSTDDSLSVFIQTIVNTLLFVIGSVAVITIIIAGIRYTTSHGDAKGVQVAKDTLFYAVIGLVVAISAYAIVNFVIFKFFVK